MGGCSYCGQTSVLTRSCNHCGREVCTDHTLPENHECVALNQLSTNTKHLQSHLDAKRSDQSKQDAKPAVRNDTATAGYNPEKTMDDSEQTPAESSPDVAPDGSLVEKGTELDAELDRLHESTDSRTSQRATTWLSVGLLGKRLKLLVLDFRLWLVILAALSVGYYFGLV